MKSLRGSSITRQLAVLFAIVVMLTLAAAGSYLYRSLANQLKFRDDSELLGKVTQTRHLLDEVGSVDDIAQARDSFLNVVFAHEGLIFLLARPGGEVLIQNVRSPIPLPSVPAVPVAREPAVEDIHDWKNSGAPARIIVARGAVGGSGGEELDIVLAREGGERIALLASYRTDLILAGIIGALVASALGWLTVRRGLAPVGVVARKANEISSRRLDTRLDIEEAPAELRELTSAFNAMLDRLEDGVRRLSGFSADLAHDLRTPVNALMVKTQVGLTRHRTPEEYRALLESNVDEYERLSRLIESTLFLARADNAQFALRLEPVDVRAALDKIAEYFSGVAEDVGVKLAVTGEAAVEADPTLLERAVSNLISNAIRHGEPGHIVRITTRAHEDAVAIEVENTGAAIPADHLDRMFDRYFRGDPSRTESSGSAGLGLAIVRAIMGLHGGRAQVTSTQGITTFILTFPKGKPV
jgi:two-component system, OmpR family, heavy metal sensor histidine kinase CusS